VDEVCVWLKTLRVMDKTLSTFRDENITGRALHHLASVDELKDMGVTAFGDRRVIADAIAQLILRGKIKSLMSMFSFFFFFSQLDGLQLVEKINSGKFGIVWRGTYDGKPVAVKQPVLNDADLSPEQQVQDLEEEYDVMKRIPAHENILKTLGMNRFDQKIYLIVEVKVTKPNKQHTITLTSFFLPWLLKFF
jgi:hypothetical protein